MPERDYSHRDVVDKLGVKAGFAVAFGDNTQAIDPALRARILERTGRPAAEPEELADVVLLAADASTDVAALLKRWRARIEQDGGIWLLTAKRGQPGYVDQRELIEAGPTAGVVDNKVCSVDDRTSAMRFVIRKTDRV
ncbi:MAG: DUF3052 family protein [Chloroflexi bacterium]|nr:DUF3052 family protein [Chloroflexota bacterium]